MSEKKEGARLEFRSVRENAEWVSDEFFSRAMREKPQSQPGWVFFLPKMEKDWTWHFPC